MEKIQFPQNYPKKLKHVNVNVRNLFLYPRCKSKVSYACTCFQKSLSLTLINPHKIVTVNKCVFRKIITLLTFLAMFVFTHFTAQIFAILQTNFTTYG